jgi:hypothetical protein
LQKKKKNKTKKWAKLAKQLQVCNSLRLVDVWKAAKVQVGIME